MKYIVFSTFLYISMIGYSFAAKVVSDPTNQIVTHCGIVLDSGNKIDSPVESVANGKRCNFDVTNVSSGQHTITATFVNIDPIWGRLESVPTGPFIFTKSNLPSIVPELSITP